MTQVNLSMKQKQTHRCKKQTCCCQRGGKLGDGSIGSLELVIDYYICIMDKQQGPTV